MGGGETPPNLVILEFGLASSKCSSGKNYAIEPKILHNWSKRNSCRENFDKFTKKLQKNLCLWGKLPKRSTEKFGKKVREAIERISPEKYFFRLSVGHSLFVGQNKFAPLQP